MNYFHGNIEKLTLENTNYRKVIFTSEYSQLVLMSIPAGEDIELENHPYVDQFFRFEKGRGKVVIGKDQKESFNVSDGSGVVIPHNTYHRIINIGSEPLKLYTIYSPPNHPRGKVEPKKVPEDECKYKQVLRKIISHY